MDGSRVAPHSVFQLAVFIFTLNYSPSSSASPGVDAGFRGTQWFS
jgi:hypothetical protein